MEVIKASLKVGALVLSEVKWMVLETDYGKVVVTDTPTVVSMALKMVYEMVGLKGLSKVVASAV